MDKFKKLVARTIVLAFIDERRRFVYFRAMEDSSTVYVWDSPSVHFADYIRSSWPHAFSKMSEEEYGDLLATAMEAIEDLHQKRNPMKDVTIHTTRGRIEFTVNRLYKMLERAVYTGRLHTYCYVCGSQVEAELDANRTHCECCNEVTHCFNPWRYL